ncbi:hypothetical protein HK099_007582 [Clydaea vesicula]|uniref:Arrestin-like N-terminal domain-containing protein n=1 Tax=Clydaea vesicula TaxID=447962 RepID=A0AAD5TWC5_9FUNG|nr:hypothetical protein HK099_007582 [Clydaea vesicula]KAJ3379511.1 hypothetical protein HDU92_006631 [Lobulomyces angularis]
MLRFPTLQVHIDQQQILITNDLDSPPQVLTGYVTLHLFKPISPNKISVVFHGHESISIPAFDVVTYHRIIKLKQTLWKKGTGDIEPFLSGNRIGNTIEPGIHVWPFFFEIPNNLKFPTVSALHGDLYYQCTAILNRSKSLKQNLKASEEVKVTYQCWRPPLHSGSFSVATIQDNTTLNEFNYKIIIPPILSKQDLNLKANIILSNGNKDVDSIIGISCYISEKQMYKFETALESEGNWTETVLLSKAVKFKTIKSEHSKFEKDQRQSLGEFLKTSLKLNDSKELIFPLYTTKNTNVDTVTKCFEISHFLNFEIEYENETKTFTSLNKRRFSEIFLLKKSSDSFFNDDSDEETFKKNIPSSTKNLRRSSFFDTMGKKLTQFKEYKIEKRTVSISVPIIIVGAIEE